MDKERAEKLCRILEEKGTKMRNEEFALAKKCCLPRKILSH